MEKLNKIGDKHKEKYEKSGIVLVHKPAGISSNAVVNIVKRVLNAKKCGHLGTLDLEGEGLLPVTVNNATKLFDFFLNKDKTYETVFVFGFETDTLDLAGEVVKEKECDINEEDVQKTIKTMIGKYLQMPPLYSAKKVNGQTAYKVARSGGEVELHPKEIEIYDFKLLEKLSKNTYRFEISCSSGTYIRSVCRDLAEKLSTYGSMQCILRTRCGGFYLKDAYHLEKIKSGEFEVCSCDNLFDYEKIMLSEKDKEKLLNGQILNASNKNGCYRLFQNEEFIGVGKIEENKLKLILRLI